MMLQERNYPRSERRQVLVAWEGQSVSVQNNTKVRVDDDGRAAGSSFEELGPQMVASR